MSKERISRRRLLRVATAAGTIPAVGTASASAQSRDPLDRYVVGTDPGAADVAANAAAQTHRVLEFGGIGAAVSGWFPEEAIAGLANSPAVRYVEREGVMEAIDHATDGADPTTEQALPWGVDRVDAEVAHHDGETGAGSSVAIVDSGIDPDHETLAVTGGEAFVECRGSCSTAWDDDDGHGTHCAGIADAVDNGVGVVGVSTAADLYAVKVLDGDGSGTYSDVAAGIEWTADRGIDVASVSLGGGDSQVVRDACQYAYQQGTLVVAAAGNDGPGSDTVSYPAAYEDVIAVSATNEADEIADFSSRGPEVELAAPGVDVLSSLPGDDYDRWSGTSMACPHVSGAGAQLMEHGYTNGEARTRLAETAEDVGLDSTEQGNGLLDVAAALDDGSGDASLAVATDAATDVDASSATLHGELTALDGYDAATVYFEWGPSGEGLPNATADQTLDAAGTFDAAISGLDADTQYEFRAVAEADGDADVGDVLSFTTDAEGSEASAPAIDGFAITDRSNPRWARVRVEWTVSDSDGDLDLVESSLELDGSSQDAESTSVSGGTASGEHDLRVRDGHGRTYDVVLTVTDSAGHSTTETKQITL